MEPRNRLPAWRAGTAALLHLPASQATYAGGMDSLESVPGLLKRLQIRALEKTRHFVVSCRIIYFLYM
jgi:hypothetical protein